MMASDVRDRDQTHPALRGTAACFADDVLVQRSERTSGRLPRNGARNIAHLYERGAHAWTPQESSWGIYGPRARPVAAICPYWSEGLTRGGAISAQRAARSP